MSEPKPCPFCGSEEVYVQVGSRIAYVRCVKPGCNAVGPERASRSAAVNYWNRREGEK